MKNKGIYWSKAPFPLFSMMPPLPQNCHLHQSYRSAVTNQQALGILKIRLGNCLSSLTPFYSLNLLRNF